MPIVYYKCSKCHMTRDSYEEAVKCEESHLTAVSVKELEYQMGPYPFRVALVFPDGKEREYFEGRLLAFWKEVRYENNQNANLS